MSREDVESKARRYLCEGRLVVRSVTPASVEALCRGSDGLYRLGYRGGSWSCDCPARGRCAHLVALQLVAVRPGSQVSPGRQG